MYISLGMLFMLLLCVWFAYVFLPELDKAQKERDLTYFERREVKLRKKEERRLKKENRTKWWQYPEKKKKPGIEPKEWPRNPDGTEKTPEDIMIESCRAYQREHPELFASADSARR